MSKRNKAINSKAWVERLAKSAKMGVPIGALVSDGMGALAPESEFRTFFEEAIQLSPNPAPFQGFTPEELDRLFAEIAAEPCFAASTGEEA